MTGFGRAKATAQGFQLEVELRTLNSRFLEVRIRGLNDYPELLYRTEEKLRRSFLRGSVEALVRLTPLPEIPQKTLDLELARKYLTELRTLTTKLDLAEKPGLSHLLTIGVFQESRPEAELLWPALNQAIAAAIHMAQEAQARESVVIGAALAREAQKIQELLGKAESLADADQKLAEKRWRECLKDLAELDPGRLNAEISAFLARCNVSEELDRLRAHSARLAELLCADGPVGKELEFLAQEIGREAGALSAKAFGPELGMVALELRLCAERLREQARNVE